MRAELLRGLQLTVGLALLAAGVDAYAWRSALYPEDWTPQQRDAQGRFLHDFSYAGYHSGELPIPDEVPGIFVDVTLPPYDADNSGTLDTTAALQQAIDDVGNAGGGVVYLPAGTYRISRAMDAKQALWVGHSGVVLRGAGPDQTFILNTTTEMRHRYGLWVGPRSNFYNWYAYQHDVRNLTQDLLEPTFDVFVDDTAGYEIGDWVVVCSDATDELIADHGMTGTWSPEDTGGPIFYRQLVEIDHAAGRVRLDAPTRYPVLMRDGGRLARIRDHIAEVGIEELAVGNLENTTAGFGDMDYENEGTGAHQVHASYLVFMNHTVDSWVKNVHSFRSPENVKNVHLLSGAFRIDYGRRITVDSVVLRRPQYEGKGGNGYMFVQTGQDCLITNCVADHGRHNYSHGFMHASGSVIHRSISRAARLPMDFHQRLSMANLLDNLTIDDDAIEAIFRDCCTHGHGTTQSVIWNTLGLSYRSDQWFHFFIIESQQYETGYVIGTHGPAYKVFMGFGLNDTAPLDFKEGIGEGETLEPESLYEDQLARRIGPAVEPGPDGGPAMDGGMTFDPDGAPGFDGGPGPGMDGGFSGDADLGPGDQSPPAAGDERADTAQHPDADPSLEPHRPDDPDILAGGCAAVPTTGALVSFLVLPLIFRPRRSLTTASHGAVCK